MLFGLHYNIGFIQQTLKYAEPSIVRFDKVCRLCVTLRIYLPLAANFLELILFIETLWPIQPNLDVKNHWSKLALCRNKSIKLSELVDCYLCFETQGHIRLFVYFFFILGLIFRGKFKYPPVLPYGPVTNLQTFYSTLN